MKDLSLDLASELLNNNAWSAEIPVTFKGIDFIITVKRVGYEPCEMCHTAPVDCTGADKCQMRKAAADNGCTIEQLHVCHECEGTGWVA